VHEQTVARSLKPGDRLALVTFSSTAHLALHWTAVSEVTLGSVDAAIQLMDPFGGTNLWAGLEYGLALCGKEPADPRRSRHLLVFTDGCPNVDPPRGIPKMLQIAKAESGNQLPCAIWTFGFGYDLDSALLDTIASIGNGMYSFIPDASFVGTVFCHAMGAMLTTVRDAGILDVMYDPAACSNPVVMGDFLFDNPAPGFLQVHTGPIHLGQPKGFVLAFDCRDADSEISVRCQGTQAVVHAGAGVGVGVDVREMLDKHVMRLQASAVMRAAASGGTAALVAIENMASAVESSMRAWPGTDTAKYLAALQLDLTKECTLAVEEPAAFGRWGRHFLTSIGRAHQHGMCNNFKDPGVQMYGGVLFGRIRDDVDKVFCSLPPPQGSLLGRRFGAGGGGGASTSYSMCVYSCDAGACFHGKCLVELSRGRQVTAAQVKVGDVLSTGGTVTCVLETRIPGKQATMATLTPSGLCLTPHHPVKQAGTWAFPVDLTCAVVGSTAVDAVFSYLVHGAQTVVVNGLECVVLGHELQKDPVTAHEFWGSQQRVRSALAKLPGFAQGHVVITPSAIVRGNNGLGEVVDICSQ
jgi:hypothetical protein